MKFGSILNILKDKKIYDFVKTLLVQGYTKNNIPKEIPIKIIRILREHQKPSLAKKEINKLPEIKNKSSIFWAKRKEYEVNKVRYYRIFSFIKGWLKGTAVLDVGCGSGILGSVILEHYKSRQYIGTDIYLRTDRAKKKLKFLKQKTETDIPIKDASADTILMVDMLHHVYKNKQPNLVRNVKKKLAKDGALVFFEYAFSEAKKPLLKNKNHFKFMKLSKEQKLKVLAFMDWISNILILDRVMPMPYAYRLLEEWEEFFQKKGFKIIKSQYIGFPQEFFHRGPYILLVLKTKK